MQAQNIAGLFYLIGETYRVMISDADCGVPCTDETLTVVADRDSKMGAIG